MRTIILSQRVEQFAPIRERRDSSDQRLSTFILHAGYLPVPMPNGLPDGVLVQWLTAINPVGLVLSGGGDVGMDPDRDATERVALLLAKARGWGVVGICRGMQQLAVCSGSELGELEGHIGVRHYVDGAVSREVNSFHRHALKACPPGFLVAGRSDDGQIEAIVHESLPWQGWMWHPEREDPFHPNDIESLRALVSSAEVGESTK